MPVDPYDVTLKCFDLMSLAKGLPQGSIKLGDLTREDYVSEIKSLAKARNSIEWALICTIYAAHFEYEMTEQRVLRHDTNMHNFPWGKYLYYASKVVPRISEYNIPWDIQLHPELYNVALCKGSVEIQPEHRKAIMLTALANRWPITVIKRIMKFLGEYLNKAPGNVSHLLEALKIPIEMRMHSDDNTGTGLSEGPPET